MLTSGSMAYTENSVKSVLEEIEFEFDASESADQLGEQPVLTSDEAAASATCVSHDAGDSGRGEDGGTNRQEQGGGKGGGGGMGIMKMLQGAHHRFESQEREMSQGKGCGSAGQSSDSPQPSAARSPADDQRPVSGTPILEELFKNALLSHHQKPGAWIDHSAALSPTDPSTQPLPSIREAELTTSESGVPRVPDPYSLLASGGMTVQEFELRQRHPYKFEQQRQKQEQQQQQQKQQQQQGKQPQQLGESSRSSGQPQWEEQAERSSGVQRKSSLDALSTPLQTAGQQKSQGTESNSQEVQSAELGIGLTGNVALLTPSDFENRTPLSIRQQMEAADRQRGVDGPPDLLQRPQVFPSPALHSAFSTPCLSRLHLTDPLPASSEIEPLTRTQFQQAILHMITTDEEFVNRLHEAYLGSFFQMFNRTTKR